MSNRSDPPPRLVWTAVQRSDLAELAGLIGAVEAADQPKERVDEDQLVDHLTESGFDPGRDTRLGRDVDGTLRAYAWNHPQDSDRTVRRVLLRGGVHPGWRRRGLGHELLRWQLAAARRWYAQTRTTEHGPLRFIVKVDQASTDLPGLCVDAGLEPSRWFSYLTQPLADPPPTPGPVDGIDILALTPDRAEAVRLTHNEAFGDHWGMQPIDPAPWTEQLAASTCRLDWSLVAVDRATDEVVGYAVNAAYEAEWGPQGYSEGQTDRLGVRRAWRHRGVASALLQRSMQLFHHAGMQAAGLGVDSASPTGADRLYEQLGYRPVSSFVVHTLTESAPAR